MSLANFIPAVWAAELLAALDKQLHYAQAGVVNRSYEGEIAAYGDRVKINAIGDVTIGTYTKDTNISSPEALTSSQQELIIDQARYFNFAIDDVDKAQSKPDVMQEAMRRSAYGFADAADSYVASLMAAAIGTTNNVGTVASPKTDLGTASVPYNYLVDLGVLLDKANTPEMGRWVIVPPWFHGLLLKDSRFVGNGSLPSDQRLMNGIVGEAAGFRILKSNNVPYTTTTTGFRIIAGHEIAVSYAEQVLDMEAYRPELRFGDAMKGLHVYGAKVVRPSNLAILVANSA